MQQRPQEALSILQQCLRLEPNNGRLLINVGACFHYMGNYQKAGLYFSEALRRTARSRIALLWQIKNRLESGNTANIDKDLEELLTRASIGKLTAWLHKRVAMEIYKDDVLVPRIDDKLIDLIKAQYLRKLDQMGGNTKPRRIRHETSTSPLDHRPKEQFRNPV